MYLLVSVYNIKCVYTVKCYSVRVITLSVILVFSLYSFTHYNRHVNTQSTMLQKKVIIVTQCYSMLPHKVLQNCNKASVNHYICNVVNTSFFLICVFMCIHIRTYGGWPMPTVNSQRNCAYDAASWRMVRAANVCQFTRSYKVCEITMTYLSTTTVMESVATTCSV